MIRKILIIGIFVINVLIGAYYPVIVHTQTTGGDSQIPALNPFCWKRKDCWAARLPYINGSPNIDNPTPAARAELDKGFVSDKSVAPCFEGDDPGGPAEWGRCLPAGVSKTAISFGGRSEFNNIGDFILEMYKYLITVASIVAVIVIIVAGIQWITSAGNSESISSAKNRIGGAVIGLFIAYMSYFILNTINPNLVNFRLPQVWLVRPENLIPKFCRDVPGAQEGKIKFLYYSDHTDQASPVDVSKGGKDDLVYGKQKDGNNNFMFRCGRRFLVEKGGAQTCFGDICSGTNGIWRPDDWDIKPDQRSLCANTFDNKEMRCLAGDLLLHLFMDNNDSSVDDELGAVLDKVPIVGFFFGGRLFQHDWLRDSANKFWGVCDNKAFLYLANNGESKKMRGWLVDIKETKPYREYILVYDGLVNKASEWSCDHGGELVGFFLRKETELHLNFIEAWENVFGDEPHYPNLNIGYDVGADRAVFGSMGGDVMGLSQATRAGIIKTPERFAGFKNYIPLSKLREGGLQLEIGFSVNKAAKIIDHAGDNPGRYNNGVGGASPKTLDPNTVLKSYAVGWNIEDPSEAYDAGY